MNKVIQKCGKKEKSCLVVMVSVKSSAIKLLVALSVDVII